ncbi:MAG: glycosyltransferase family 4 protein [Verrucomicrobiae bacterium]|nr:glycosyltransferase family 4 protein [Verrucomicrobiae bacterium]
MPAPAGRRKVLIFVQSDAWGGMENHFLTLTLNLAATQEYWPVVAMLRLPATAEAFDALAARGIPVMHLSGVNDFSLRAFIKSLWWLRRIRPEIAHFMLGGPGALPCPTLAASLLGRPFLLTEHGCFDEHIAPPGVLKKWIRRWVGRRAVTTICVSNETRRRLERVYGVPAGRMVVIHNGVDLKAFDDRASAESSSDFGSRHATRDARTPVIICVARLNALKGHRYLVEALSGLPDAELWLVGNGETRLDLERQAAQSGLACRIKFLGQRSDVPQLLRQADVFCLPSLTEGLPLCVIEAMAARLPVVAARVGGLTELVVEGETGFLVEPKNPEALRDRLARLLADPALRERMGAAGRRRVEEQFNLPTMLRRTREIYASVFQERAAGTERGAQES